jgi:hypothetical protein
MLSRAKEAMRRFLQTSDKSGKVEWARSTKSIPQTDGSTRRLVTRKDGIVEKDDFLSLEGALKDVDIERPIKELGKQWNTRKRRRAL